MHGAVTWFATDTIMKSFGAAEEMLDCAGKCVLKVMKEVKCDDGVMVYRCDDGAVLCMGMRMYVSLLCMSLLCMPKGKCA